jgi:hypothetical protein
MRWIATNPESYDGQVVGSGQCVAYVERACGAPHTSQWKRGDLVKGSNVAQGFAIATFEPDGAYGNTPGRSHAAVFHQQNPSGLLVWDQWVHHPVAPRLIRFKGGEGLPVDDGDQFYVIEAV